MRRNPLVLFLGAAIVAILAVIGFTYPKWAPSSPTQEAAAPAAETAAATPAEPAATEAAPQTDPAATELIKPTFDVVRVEPDGSAVVAGRASPAADVVVTISGNELGAAKATENGEWVVVTTTPIAPGSYELKAVAKVGDKEVASDQSVALAVPAAGSEEKVLAVVSEPNQPSQVLSQVEPAADNAAAAADTTTAAAEPAAAETAAAEPAAAETAAAEPAAAEAPLTGTVSIDTVDYNDQGDVLFSGKGPADADVRLYANNNPLGFAAVSPEGTWTFTSRGLIEPGEYTLRADAVDDNGKVVARIEVPFSRATAEAVAEAPKDGKVIIQPGNNLWRISRVIYGDGTRYTVIYEANKDQIRNPDLIYPGQILMTPGVVPPETIDPDSREPLPSVQ